MNNFDKVNYNTLVKCPKCGVINTDETAFCSLCLHPLKEIEDASKRAAAYREALSRRHFNQGCDYQLEGAPLEAISEYDEAIRLNPRDGDAYNNRGNAYRDLGDHRQDLEDFNRAIDLDPHKTSPHYNRGMTYIDLGLYRNALDDFNDIIRLDPESTHAITARENVFDLLKNEKS